MRFDAGEAVNLCVRNCRRLFGTADAVYETVVPAYCRWKFCRRSNGYDVPLDPCKILWIPPDAIVRFTGRPYPPWKNLPDHIGAVRTGDWDRRGPVEFDTDYDGTPPSLYLAETFTDTVVHRSLVDHFVRGVAWRRTDIVQEMLDVVHEREFVWGNCRTEADVWHKCAKLDRLYDEVKREGELDVDEAAKHENGAPRRFIDQLTNQIVVDIARDGEFLFVEGRHRLSIAKILDIDRVPVVVCVRHKEWMDRREQLYHGRETPDHPDLAELRRTSPSPVPQTT